MPEKPLKVLLVEDDAKYARLLSEMLAEQISDANELTRLASMAEAESYLTKHTAEVIVLDLGLPDTQGLTALRRVRAVAPHVPLVVLTALDDVVMALQALREGAQDYFVKDEVRPAKLYRAMCYAIERKNMEMARRGAKDRAEQAEALLRDAVASTSEGFVIYDC
jgi:DNA-binding response OmpR family regulator